MKPKIPQRNEPTSIYNNVEKNMKMWKKQLGGLKLKFLTNVDDFNSKEGINNGLTVFGMGT